MSFKHWLVAGMPAASSVAHADIQLLNASYDIARAFCKDYNALFAAHAAVLKPIRLYDVDSEFGGWSRVQKEHFADNAAFDRVILKAKQ